MTCQTSQGGPHVSQGGPHVSQGGPHESQGRGRRQAVQIPDNDVDQNEDDSNWPNGPNWTTCEYTASSPLSCNDCNTRLICKPIGGLLISCKNPLKPYCNNGICSATPSEGC